MTTTRSTLFRWTWITLGLVVAAIAWTHASVLSAGLRYDDYFAIRPWTAAELRSVLTGSWDPLGLQDPYHRPLTALYQSLWYPLFGYNARALHAVSLVELGIVAAMLAAFVGRELRRPAAGVLAALLLIVHPLLPDSSSAWIFNQMSLLADLTVVGALLVWQRVRTGPPRGWWPVWALTVVSFYIKEDGAMLAPALLSMQWWRARRLNDGSAPPMRLWLTGAAVLLVLAAVRVAIYPIASPWPPEPGHFSYYLTNLLTGPYHALLRLPGESPAGVAANVGVVLALLLALIVIWRVSRRRVQTEGMTLFGSGVLLMAWLGAPLVLMSGPTRSHLVTLAAALTITAAIVIVFDAIATAALRRWFIAAVAATLMGLSMAARDVNSHYAPCSDDTLDLDTVVVTEEAVAPELRAWVEAKRAACAAHTYQPMPADIHVSRRRP